MSKPNFLPFEVHTGRIDGELKYIQGYASGAVIDGRNVVIFCGSMVDLQKTFVKVCDPRFDPGRVKQVAVVSIGNLAEKEKL